MLICFAPRLRMEAHEDCIRDRLHWQCFAVPCSFLSLQEMRGEDNTDAASALPAPEDVRAHMCLVQPSFSLEDV